MADIQLREREGWQEITDLIEEDERARDVFIGIWRAYAQSDLEAMRQALWIDSFHDPEAAKPPQVEAVEIISIPDDFLGERYRVWVRWPSRHRWVRPRAGR